MAQAGDDHMPPLIEYVERCLNSGDCWSLNVAEGLIGKTVRNVNRSKIKLLAGRWLHRELRESDPRSLRACQIQRLLAEMSRESNATLRKGEPFRRLAQRHTHYDARTYQGINYNARVRQEVRQQVGIDMREEFRARPQPRLSVEDLEPATSPSTLKDYEPGPTPEGRRKPGDLLMETILANSLEFECKNKRIMLSATRDNILKLWNLNMDFKCQGSKLVLTNEDEGSGAEERSPKAKKQRFEKGESIIDDPMAVDAKTPTKERTSVPPAEHGPHGRDLLAGLVPSVTVQGDPVTRLDDMALPANQTPPNGDATGRVPPPKGVELQAIVPRSREDAGEERELDVGGNVAKPIVEAQEHLRFELKAPGAVDMRGSNEAHSTDEATTGRASPPQGVELHGAVRSTPNNTDGNAFETGTEDKYTDGDGHSAKDGVSSGVVEASGVSDGMQQMVAGRSHGNEARSTDVATRRAAPPQGVEPRGAFLSAGDKTNVHKVPTTGGEEGEEAAHGNVGHVRRPNVSNTAEPSNERGEVDIFEGVSADDVKEGEDEDRTLPAQTADVTAPSEPNEEGEPDAGMAAARERLALANEILAMETVELLDAMLELSRGVLKGEAAALSVLEAKRQAGTLPVDGGSVFERIVSAYKTKTGNPDGKQVFKNIREWEAARDAVLEAEFALMQTEEKPAEREGGAREEGRGTGEGKGKESQRMAGEGGRSAAFEGDANNIGEEFVGNGPISDGAENDQGEEDKENETGFELNSESASAMRRGVLTENGQNDGESIRQDGKRTGGAEGQKSGGGPRQAVEPNEIDGAKGVSEESDQIDARANTDESPVEAAADVRRGSFIPMPPHLRVQTPSDCDYVTVRGRGSGVGDAASQRLIRSRSVSPGRPPRYGERRRSQGASGIPVPANPGYVSSAGLLHVINMTATSSDISPAETTAPPPTVSAPNPEEELPLNAWVEKRAGCAFVVGAGGLAPAAIGSGMKPAATGRPADTGMARASATEKGSKAPPEEETRAVMATSLAGAGPGSPAAGGHRERVRTMAQQEAAAAEQAAAAKEQHAVAAGADPSPGVWAELVSCFLGEKNDPELQLDKASKPVDVSDVDVTEDEGVAAAVGLLRLASAVPHQDDQQSVLEEGDDEETWLSSGKMSADAMDGTQIGGKVFEDELAGVAERWLQQ